MKYKVSVIKSFAGAHFLRQYKGKCENLHGHNWKIRAAFSGSKLADDGMLIDFTEVKARLDEIIMRLDHKLLNEVEPFDKINPTAENIAAFIFTELKKAETQNAKVQEAQVWESDSAWALVCDDEGDL
jgi:6-pyruvoyltetrahydropterin/6-carboxytetrahydropterin synthase